jgi:hypothetical protein
MNTGKSFDNEYQEIPALLASSPSHVLRPSQKYKIKNQTYKGLGVFFKLRTQKVGMFRETIEFHHLF